jgi:hypothetical protein
LLLKAEGLMMNKHILYIVMMMVFLSSTFQKATFGDVSANEQNSDVSIIITKFQVNDQALELGLKIINDTDHDIWICDSVNTDGVRDFEVFMAEDNQTLVVRRRFDLNPDQAGFVLVRVRNGLNPYRLPYPLQDKLGLRVKQATLHTLNVLL